MELTPKTALALWQQVGVSALHQELPDLTARQFALLLHVYMGAPPHTVRGLAHELNMSKPAVSRALDRLEGLGFLRRKPDQSDRRSILVSRTVKGAVFLSDFGELVAEVAERL